MRSVGLFIIVVEERGFGWNICLLLEKRRLFEVLLARIEAIWCEYTFSIEYIYMYLHIVRTPVKLGMKRKLKNFNYFLFQMLCFFRPAVTKSFLLKSSVNFVKLCLLLKEYLLSFFYVGVTCEFLVNIYWCCLTVWNSVNHMTVISFSSTDSSNLIEWEKNYMYVQNCQRNLRIIDLKSAINFPIKKSMTIQRKSGKPINFDVNDIPRSCDYRLFMLC